MTYAKGKITRIFPAHFLATLVYRLCNKIKYVFVAAFILIYLLVK